MKKIFILTFIMLCVIINAQQTYGGVDTGLSNNNLLYSKSNLKEDKINEKYYLDTNYSPAKIDGYNGIRSYRYNALTDDFEYIDNNNIFKLLKLNGLIISFLNNGRTYIYLTSLEKNNETGNYYEVLTNEKNNIVLYKTTRINEIENLNKNGYNQMENKKIVMNTKYFLGNKDKLFEVPKSDKKLEELLNKNVQLIIKENKLNIKKEQDLIKLVDILNK